ncbi:Lipase 5 [Lecanosticta acicola]|uniref:Carboxylic ester hydrolase n=1 Tax=Lecanosticta acicola TaxID=111012 RepID=A0AAI8Z3N5_9PEZI|nr:Lipase 5 [Lecanosticta acicola]
MTRFALLSLLTAVAIAAPLDERQSGPSVTIENGTVVGSSSEGVDSFKGIPYAQPPVGNLRLRPAQSITTSFGTIQATGSPSSCPQFFTQVDTDNVPEDAVGVLLDSPLLQEATMSSEDCLTMNVQRPTGTNSSSDLPVLFWIFGGGFEFGSTSMYDASSIVQQSIKLGQPIIYVSVNYRLGGFGFLAGSDLAKEGSTNLGLRDQRMGLHWTAENIKAFGGDPSKVTIWGESAGSISVFDHTVINGGDNTYNGKPLFRGGIMNSGSVVPATDVSSAKPQAVYDTVVENAGCSSASDKLACLRSTDYTTFLNAANSVPGIFSYQSLDLSYLPRPDPGDNFFSQSPEISINADNFTKVPLIIGDQEDEGTLFSLVTDNITTNQQLHDYVASYFPANPTVDQDVTNLLTYYPDEPLEGQPAGSPFRTGPLNNIYPQFKRLAAILGDLTFTLARRVYLETIQPKQSQPTWSYLSSFFYGTPVLGTFHASDLLFSYELIPGPNEVQTTLQTYYVSFVNYLDPNALGNVAPMINWPQWTTQSPQLMNFLSLSNQIIEDDFRKNASDYLMTSQAKYRI